jgi:hypothetical protein
MSVFKYFYFILFFPSQLTPIKGRLFVIRR